MDDLSHAVNAFKSGDGKTAEKYCLKVLEQDRGNSTALYILGLAARQRKDFKSSIKYLESARVNSPDNADILFSLACACINCGDPEQAALHLERVIARNPKWTDAVASLGYAYQQIGRHEDAVAQYEQAVSLDSGSAGRWSDLASAYLAWGRYEAAIQGYATALKLKPESADILHNLGTALQRMAHYDEAIPYLQQAVAAAPTHLRAHINLGTSLKMSGRIPEAVDILRRAVKIDPENADAQWNLALTLLLSGQEEEGWERYEWRRKIPAIRVKDFEHPSWDGSHQPDKILLLHAEQGLGDTLQFIRYASRVRGRVSRLIFLSQAPLIPLLSQIKEIDVILPLDHPLPQFDIHSPLMSLPHLLGTADISDAVPYLHPEKALLEQWSERLARFSGFRIGICWQGNPSYNADRQRSMPLDHFLDLAQMEGVHVFSLQKKHGTEQLDKLPDPAPFVDLGPDLDEEHGAFMDTAAVIAHLDLVVTTDTAVAHLAGAMGSPVFLLLSHVPDWRWGLSGDLHAWYPGMRLFRQEEAGSRRSLFQKVREAVHRLIEEKTGRIT